MCIPCIHTEHEITTISANAAIFKPLQLWANAGHMPTAKTHCLSTERTLSLFLVYQRFYLHSSSDRLIRGKKISEKSAAFKKYSIISGH